MKDVIKVDFPEVMVDFTTTEDSAELELEIGPVVDEASSLDEAWVASFEADLDLLVADADDPERREFDDALVDVCLAARESVEVAREDPSAADLERAFLEALDTEAESVAEA